MDFQIIPRRTGVYMQIYNSEGFSELKLPNERFPLKYFKKIFDETPQTKLKINCLAAILSYTSIAPAFIKNLEVEEQSYIFDFIHPTLSSFILNIDYFWAIGLRLDNIPDLHNVICNAAERNYSNFISKVIHLVPQRTKNAALGYAANWGNLDTVKVLVKNDAEVNSFGGSALRFAQENGQRETIEYLLSCGA